MRRDFVTTDPREMLQTAFSRLQECDCHALPVVEAGHLVGLLTAERVAEVLMIQESLSLREQRGRRGLGGKAVDGQRNGAPSRLAVASPFDRAPLAGAPSSDGLGFP